MMDNGEKPAHEYTAMRYPFLSETFPFKEPEFVITNGAYEHLYAEPEECEDPCAAQDVEIAELEKELDDLKTGYYAQRESNKKPTSTKSTYTRPTTKPSSSYKKPSYSKYQPSYSKQSYADKYYKSKPDYADL